MLTAHQFRSRDLLHTASSGYAVTALLQAAVALLLPPLADAELFGEAIEEYFVRDAGELRDQAAGAQLEEQARALKAQAGAAQHASAAVAKLRQAWPLPEALAALRLALQEPPAEPLDGAGTAREQQVPAEHIQAAGSPTQEPPAQHLQAAGPASQEQPQMHAKHLQSTGPVTEDQQEPSAGSLHEAGAVAGSRQQAQLGRPPTDAPRAQQPSDGDRQLGHEQQQSPEHQSAPQQGVRGEQQGQEQEMLSSSIEDKLQLFCHEQEALPEPSAGCTQIEGPQHAANTRPTPAGDSAAKAAAQEQPASAASEAGLPAVPAIQICHEGRVEAQVDLAESDGMPTAPIAICNNIPSSAQVGRHLASYLLGTEHSRS